MRNLGFFAVAALLILVQSNLFRLLGPLGTLLGAHWVHGATPSLALPLVIFLGVHEPSMPRGAALSFAIGYAQDLLGGAPVGPIYLRLRDDLVALTGGGRPADGANHAHPHVARFRLRPGAKRRDLGALGRFRQRQPPSAGGGDDCAAARGGDRAVRTALISLGAALAPRRNASTRSTRGTDVRRAC